MCCPVLDEVVNALLTLETGQLGSHWSELMTYGMFQQPTILLEFCHHDKLDISPVFLSQLQSYLVFLLFFFFGGGHTR